MRPHCGPGGSRGGVGRSGEVGPEGNTASGGMGMILVGLRGSGSVGGVIGGG